MKALVVRAEWAPKEGYVLNETEKRRKLAYNSNMVWKNPTWSVEKDYPEPSPKSNEVKIKVAACGVCGSDVHMLMKRPDDYVFFAGEAGFPVAIGHEFAGEVVEVGSEVNNIKVGDLVTAEEVQWCGECIACRYGLFNQCENLDQLGFDCPNDGAMAEYITVQEKFVYKLNSLSRLYTDKDSILEAGSLVEPTGVAYEGMFSVAKGFQVGSHVAVFGTGPIGLAAIQLAKCAGAANIIAFELNENRRKLAEKMGADFVYDPREVPAYEVVKEHTEGFGVGMAVEAAGAYSATIPEMEKMLSIAGKIILIGMGEDFPTIHPMIHHRLGSGIYATLGHSGRGVFASVINLMASGRINMIPAVTARFDLDNAVEGVMQAGKGDDAKVLIKP
ncbi:MAG: scyllo-inosose 3-dehydrogenase [Tepidanaerobacteraceae bacterium]|jgi:threonine dehydrogenase-like Zn-dependent dehydrogenase